MDASKFEVFADSEGLNSNQENPSAGPNGQKLQPLSVRRLFDILDMEFDPADFILENGYLTKGDPLAICGAGGIGKSRLVLQLLLAVITGRDFLGWPTAGEGSKWLLLQTENNCRRLKSDLQAMCKVLSEEEKQLVHNCLLIHTIETGDDSFLNLNILENQERIRELIESEPWTGVVFDVLRDYSADDLNTDSGMQETLAIASRLTRKKNPHCIPVIIHHARPGRAGASSVAGFDRATFGRNSKVLFGWARAQINIAPCQENDNAALIIASGKCNNAEEFKPFAVSLDFTTMTYERDELFDIGRWMESLGGSAASSRSKKKKTNDQLKIMIFDLVPDPGTILKNSLINKANDAGIGLRKIRPLIHELIDDEKLFEHKSKRPKTNDLIRISRYPPIPP